jgi:hypothetical protein
MQIIKPFVDVFVKPSTTLENYKSGNILPDYCDRELIVKGNIT